MKKLVILLLLVAFCTTLSGVAQTTFSYVKYGGNLELTVKSHAESYWFNVEKKTYGIRKNGVEILPPVYSVDEVSFPADLFLLVFMSRSEKAVHIYSTETGEEIFHYVCLEDDVRPFYGFVFRRIDVRRYELSACFGGDDKPDYRSIMVFYRYRGITSQKKP